MINRPMTIPEMLRSSATMYERGDGNAECLLAVEHTLREVQERLYRARPGLDIDRMLGTDRPSGVTHDPSAPWENPEW